MSFSYCYLASCFVSLAFSLSLLSLSLWDCCSSYFSIVVIFCVFYLSFDYSFLIELSSSMYWFLRVYSYLWTWDSSSYFKLSFDSISLIIIDEEGFYCNWVLFAKISFYLAFSITYWGLDFSYIFYFCTSSSSLYSSLMILSFFLITNPTLVSSSWLSYNSAFTLLV